MKFKDSVLIFAEHDGKKIHEISYELLSKGRELAQKKNVALCAALLCPAGLDSSLLSAHGADAIFLKEADLFLEPEENVYARELADIVSQFDPSIILVGATNFGRSLAPKLASIFECGLTADCTGLDLDEEGKLIQIRPAFSENIIAHISSAGRPQMATIRFKEFEASPPDTTRTAQIIKLELQSEQQSQVKVLKELISESVDLANAKRIIACGQGLRSKEDLKLIQDLATKLDAKLAVSRPLAEEGYASKAHQVGYSGHRVKPDLYIACGISGAAQHLAGMKEAKHIIAINSDPSAPIFKLADLGIVGDLYEVIPELIAKL